MEHGKRKIINVGLDVGNTTTISFSKDSYNIVESRVIKSNDILKLSDNDKVNLFNDEYIIGLGEYENNLYKYDKQNFEILFKYSIGKVVENESYVNLCIGIPCNQFNNNRKKELIDVLRKYKNFTIKINDEYKHIIIENVIIRPEGYPVYSMVKATNKLIDKLPSVVIDIGGGTTDISSYDHLGKFIGGDSINIGLNDLYKTVQNYVISYHKNWSNFTIEQAKELCRGLLYIDINLSDCYTTIFNKIWNNIIGINSNIVNYNVILIGGGSTDFKLYFKEKCKNLIVNEDITSNAKGFYLLAKEQFGE